MSEKTSTTKAKDSYKTEDIPGGVIKALQAITGEKKRWNLECLCVKGQELVTVDGSIMARFAVQDDMGPQALYKFPKPKLLKNEPVTITRKDGKLYMEQQDGDSSRVEICESADERAAWPPEYEQAIPSEEAGTSVAVTVDNLRKTVDLLENAGHETVRVTYSNEPDMPIRLDGVQSITDRPCEFGTTIAISIIPEDNLKD